MNFYEFASNNPILTFLLVVVVMAGLQGIIGEIGKFFNPVKRDSTPTDKIDNDI